MRWLFFLFFILPQTLAAQVRFDRMSHNFGMIQGDQPRHTDFLISNTSDSVIYVITVRGDRETEQLFSSDSILAGGQETLRVQINPYEEGLFSKHIQVYLSCSEKPYQLKVSGIARDLGDLRRQQCPDFGGGRSTQRKVAEVSISLNVVDGLSGEALPQATIVFQGGPSAVVRRPGKDGVFRDEFLPGLYSIRITCPHYSDWEQHLYFSKDHAFHQARLAPLDSALSLSLHSTASGVDLVVQDNTAEFFSSGADDTPVEMISGKDKVDKVRVKAEPATPTQVEGQLIKKELPSASLDSLSDPDKSFSVFDFKSNNIVFLIDRSASMKEEGRLELLKQSMLKLVDMLRPVDYLSIVSYSSDARVVLFPVSAGNKDQIREAIVSMTASGTTQAFKGIKKAYELADSSFIEGGNNQVILATDGAFADAVKAMEVIGAEKYNGITFSVIGIRNEDWTVRQLQEISAKGGGSYISLRSSTDADTRLKAEIREKSRIIN